MPGKKVHRTTQTPMKSVLSVTSSDVISYELISFDVISNELICNYIFTPPCILVDRARYEYRVE